MRIMSLRGQYEETPLMLMHLMELQCVPNAKGRLRVRTGTVRGLGLQNGYIYMYIYILGERAYT